MADITHGTWIKDGKAVDAVYQSGVKVYGRNLLTDTSGTLKTVTNAAYWNYGLPELTPVVTTVGSDTTYTARAWIAPASHNMTLQIVWKDLSGTTYYGGGNTISAGTSGYSTWTGTFTAGTTIQRVTIVFIVEQSTDSTVSYKEMKLEKSSVATPYSPAPEDILN